MSVTDGWSPSLTTGIEALDRQHREIFTAIDALLDALRHGHAGQQVESTLKSLESYVGNHFGHEEKLIRQRSYPDLDEHVAVHGNFSLRLGERRKTLPHAGATKALAVQTLQAIGKLLVQDIETQDRKLAASLTADGKAS